MGITDDGSNAPASERECGISLLVTDEGKTAQLASCLCGADLGAVSPSNITPLPDQPPMPYTVAWACNRTGQYLAAQHP